MEIIKRQHMSGWSIMERVKIFWIKKKMYIFIPKYNKHSFNLLYTGNQPLNSQHAILNTSNCFICKQLVRGHINILSTSLLLATLFPLVKNILCAIFLCRKYSNNLYTSSILVPTEPISKQNAGIGYVFSKRYKGPLTCMHFWNY